MAGVGPSKADVSDFNVDMNDPRISLKMQNQNISGQTWQFHTSHKLSGDMGAADLGTAF